MLPTSCKLVCQYSNMVHSLSVIYQNRKVELSPSFSRVYKLLNILVLFFSLSCGGLNTLWPWWQLSPLTMVWVFSHHLASDSIGQPNLYRMMSFPDRFVIEIGGCVWCLWFWVKFYIWTDSVLSTLHRKLHLIFTSLCRGQENQIWLRGSSQTAQGL